MEIVKCPKCGSDTVIKVNNNQVFRCCTNLTCGKKKTIGWGEQKFQCNIKCSICGNATLLMQDFWLGPVIKCCNSACGKKVKLSWPDYTAHITRMPSNKVSAKQDIKRPAVLDFKMITQFSGWTLERAQLRERNMRNQVAQRSPEIIKTLYSDELIADFLPWYLQNQDDSWEDYLNIVLTDRRLIWTYQEKKKDSSGQLRVVNSLSDSTYYRDIVSLSPAWDGDLGSHIEGGGGYVSGSMYGSLSSWGTIWGSVSGNVSGQQAPIYTVKHKMICNMSYELRNGSKGTLKLSAISSQQNADRIMSFIDSLQRCINLAWEQTDYNKFIEANPNDLESYRNRGDSNFEQGRYDLAVADYSKVIELNPNIAQSYNTRGNAYFSQGIYDSAIADYSKFIELKPHEVKGYRNRSLAFYRNHQYDMAISDANKVIELDPTIEDAYRIRGCAYFDKGQYEPAIDDLSKVIRMHPNDPRIYIYRGKSYLALGQRNKVLADFKNAVKINPALEAELKKVYESKQYSVKHAGRKSSVANMEQQPSTATSHETGETPNPAEVKMYYNRGLNYIDQGQYELAIADLSKSIKLDPKNVDIYQNRGLIYLNQGKYDSAIADFSKAIEFKDDDATYYVNRGKAYLNKKQRNLAITDFKKAVKLNPALKKDLVKLIRQ